MQIGTPATTPKKNTRRVEAGRLNRQKSHGLTALGHDKLRTTIRLNKPWLRSTGPVTPAGKARSSQNGCLTRRGNQGGRALRREMAVVASLIDESHDIRMRVSELNVKNSDNGGPVE